MGDKTYTTLKLDSATSVLLKMKESPDLSEKEYNALDVALLTIDAVYYNLCAENAVEKIEEIRGL